LLIGNARSHPWLKVEVPEPDTDDGDAAPADVEFPKTAIDAGLDQDDVEYEGDGEVPIAETLAADKEQGDEPIVVDETPDQPDVPAEEN
jgi:hypothetical protein